jgi:capsular polysaccharide transport system permease protein
MQTLLTQLSDLRRGFAIQRGSIGAIIMRELVTRWGRRDLGFAWIFAEPLVFSFPVLTIWHLVRPAYSGGGLAEMPFVWSGYLPLLMFRHVTNSSLSIFSNNSAVFYHSKITPLDFFIGRQGLEALGNLGSTVFSFFVFYWVGLIDLPYDFPLFLLGFVYTIWWSLAIALLIATLSERSEVVGHIWPPFSYLYVFFSGFMFAADWLPKSLRDIALVIDPPLHTYEMVRGGLFGPIYIAHYDIEYLTFLLAGLTLLGLWLARSVRDYMQVV